MFSIGFRSGDSQDVKEGGLQRVLSKLPSISLLCAPWNYPAKIAIFGSISVWNLGHREASFRRDIVSKSVGSGLRSSFLENRRAST